MLELKSNSSLLKPSKSLTSSSPLVIIFEGSHYQEKSRIQHMKFKCNDIWPKFSTKLGDCFGLTSSGVFL